MQPGKQPDYEIVEDAQDALRYTLQVKVTKGSLPGGETAVALVSSSMKGVLECFKAELENSVLDFEEYAKDWELSDKEFEAIMLEVDAKYNG
jgi:hypothetical protein